MKKPIEIKHPRYELAELLKSEDKKQAELASELQISPSYLTEILKGNRNITTEIAYLLEVIFPHSGITAKDWLYKQVEYNLFKASEEKKNREKKATLEEWLIFKETYPARTKYLKKAKIITGKDPATDIPKLRDFYNIKDNMVLLDVVKEGNQEKYHRMSNKHKVDVIQLDIWERLVRHRSRKQKLTQGFDKNLEQELLKNLKKAFVSENIIGNTKEVLTHYGVIFLIQEKFKQTPIDGFTFWEGQNPTIALTLRYKRIDNFAFNVMHELGHIFLHLSKHTQESFMEGDIEQNDVEKEADEFAKNALISIDAYEKFLSIGALDDESIIEFAKEEKIHPAIVRGRLCFDDHVPYQRKTYIQTTLNFQKYSLD